MFEPDVTLPNLQLVVQTPALLQSNQLRLNLIQRDHLALRLRANIIAVPDIYGLSVELLLSDDYGWHIIHASVSHSP